MPVLVLANLPESGSFLHRGLTSLFESGIHLTPRPDFVINFVFGPSAIPAHLQGTRKRKGTKAIKLKPRQKGLLLSDRFGVPLGVINQPMMNGVKSQFEAVRDAELVENIVKMVLDSLLRDEKFFSNFLVAETLRH